MKFLFLFLGSIAYAQNNLVGFEYSPVLYLLKFQSLSENIEDKKLVHSFSLNYQNPISDQLAFYSQLRYLTYDFDISPQTSIDGREYIWENGFKVKTQGKTWFPHTFEFFHVYENNKSTPEQIYLPSYIGQSLGAGISYLLPKINNWNFLLKGRYYGNFKFDMQGSNAFEKISRETKQLIIQTIYPYKESLFLKLSYIYSQTNWEYSSNRTKVEQIQHSILGLQIVWFTL